MVIVPQAMGVQKGSRLPYINVRVISFLQGVLGPAYLAHTLDHMCFKNY